MDRLAIPSSAPGVFMPEQVLHVLYLLRYVSASLRLLALQCLGLLLQDREPYADVEPIEQMLTQSSSGPS
jgi:hypothetical protein